MQEKLEKDFNKSSSSGAIQIPVCTLGTGVQNIIRAKYFWPEQAQIYFLADIGLTGVTGKGQTRAPRLLLLNVHTT